MKKQFVWLLMLVCMLAGCSDGDEVFYETNDDLLNKNGIADVAAVFCREEVVEEEKVIYYGIRQGKDWFALFDIASGSLEKDWYGKARDYVRGKNPIFTMRQVDLWAGKLENGDYAMTYMYGEENTIHQLVRLSDRSGVEYGFMLDTENEWVDEYLSENRFFVYSLNSGKLQIWTFDGNLFADDVCWTGICATGFQNDKLWGGYTDSKGGFHEGISDEPFERNRRIHMGFGEYAEFYIKKIGIEESIETDWGYAFLPYYKTDYGSQSRFDLFLINGGKLVFVPIIHGGSLRNWYKESLLVYNNRDGYNSRVVSSEGKIIAELEPYSAYEEAEPVSYEEGISLSGDCFYRTNFVSCKTVWLVNVDKLDAFASNAQKTMALVKKEGTLWSYRCDIVNKDGSKDRFEFKLDVEAGKIIY